MKRIVLSIFIVGQLLSCRQEVDFSLYVTSEVNNYALTFIDAIKAGNIDTCLSMVNQEMNSQYGRTYLANTANQIASNDILSTRIVSATKFVSLDADKFSNYTVQYESTLKSGFHYFAFTIQEKGDKLKIIAFDNTSSVKSFGEINSFSLNNKSLTHYLFLVTMLAIVLFILLTIIRIINSYLNNKWLWIIGTLLGFLQFSLNWTTGEIKFQTFSFQILGVGSVRPGLVEPWTLSFALPLIGIYVWIKLYWDKRDNALIAKYNAQKKD